MRKHDIRSTAYKCQLSEIGGSMKWISIEKRKPPRGTHVLLGGSKGEVRVGFLNPLNDMDYIDYWSSKMYRAKTTMKVTHWAKLPEPPTSDNSDSAEITS